MTARVLMVQGTSSSVGKSLLVTALCRIFARQGIRVAPFKAQNMSNNAAVCADGAEIGRAQAVQAAAAGIEPTADMNPVLLKPETDSRAQVVMLGRPWRTLGADTYYRYKEEVWPVVTAALNRLRSAYELVVIEGAGSPAELNLRAGDIVNMAVALYAQAPVLLVGDVDRGGIFAQLLGTLWLLSPAERTLVRGFVVNKFRGDPDLFADGVRILEERSGVPVLGVVPYLTDLVIPAEDAVALEQPALHFSPFRLELVDALSSPPQLGSKPDAVDIVVIRLPHIANFDDFDPLAAEPGVRLRYVSAPLALGRPNAVILPGTKSTMADLAWLRKQGLDSAILRLAGEGTAVVGICGGYQMLGQVLRDPKRVEGTMSEAAGLGLLTTEVVFVGEKLTHRVHARVLGGPGWLTGLAGQIVQGYEIHMGRTTGEHAWLEIEKRGSESVAVPDGSVAGEGRIWGCYLHGLFSNQTLRRTWLSSLGSGGRGAEARGNQGAEGPDGLDAIERLADVVADALDMIRLEQIVWGN